MPKVSVRVKPGHPTGTFKRAGFTFTSTPSVIDVKAEVVSVLKGEKQLVVTDPVKAEVVSVLKGEKQLVVTDLAKAEVVSVLKAEKQLVVTDPVKAEEPKGKGEK